MGTPSASLPECEERVIVRAGIRAAKTELNSEPKPVGDCTYGSNCDAAGNLGTSAGRCNRIRKAHRQCPCVIGDAGYAGHITLAITRTAGPESGPIAMPCARDS